MSIADPGSPPTRAVMSRAQPENVNGTQPPDRVPFAVLIGRTDSARF